MTDELCRCASGGLVWGIVGGLGIGLPPVLHFGSPALQDKVAPGCLAGEKFICLAITEPYAGSDVAAIRTTAVKDASGKNYIVNGEKKWCAGLADCLRWMCADAAAAAIACRALAGSRTVRAVHCNQRMFTPIAAAAMGAPSAQGAMRRRSASSLPRSDASRCAGVFADFFTVAVRTGGEGAAGISLLLVERGPGVTTKQMDCMGVWSSGTTYITFEDVVVPVENLIGAEGDGFKMIMSNFNQERMGIVYQALRFARVCLEESFLYAHSRKTFGKRLIDHPVIRAKIAEMARHVEATQAMSDNLTHQICVMPREQAMLLLGGETALLKCVSAACRARCAALTATCRTRRFAGCRPRAPSSCARARRRRSSAATATCAAAAARRRVLCPHAACASCGADGSKLTPFSCAVCAD